VCSRSTVNDSTYPRNHGSRGLAWQLGQFRARLTLAARRQALLENLADRIAKTGAPRPLVANCDVTCDGVVERAVAESVRHWGKLDVVIANAGFGVVGPLKALSIEDYRRQFETNVFGVLRTIYAALPEIEKTRGNVVVIGSVAGWTATPGTSAYAMSKFAVRPGERHHAGTAPGRGQGDARQSRICGERHQARRQSGRVASRGGGPDPGVASYQHQQGGAPDSEGRCPGEARRDRDGTWKNLGPSGAFRTVGDSRGRAKTGGKAEPLAYRGRPPDAVAENSGTSLRRSRDRT
jgi:hypothetical protein